jgi:iron-sulfur cluster repair protein YtfE (RIC family)
MQSKFSVGQIMEADHVELDELLAELTDAIYSDQPDVVSTYRKLDLFWARLAVHIRAEHLVVFPAVLDIGEGPKKERKDIENILQELRSDHDFFIKELARAVKAMRSVPDFGKEAETFAVVRDLVDGVKRGLIRHNKIEEEAVYPLAERADAGNLEQNIRENALRELENMPQRFRAV